MSELCTIGYEGRELDSFVHRLRENGVTVLIDVRWTPISRKRGFSKGALRQAVESAGIRYMHVHTLGSPKELRTELHDGGDYKEFFRKYRNHLANNIPALQTVAELLGDEKPCLLCFERHPHQCHRHVVAEEICFQSEGAVRVKHL